MNPKAACRALFLGTGVAFLACATALADDSAAAIAVGGLVSRRETRIVMAKEVLRISPDKVVVDYDFRNDTDEDVTTEVAFPIPPYQYDPAEGPTISDASFSGFKLTVDGKSVAYRTEAKAIVKGKDVTAILTADHIDIATFGHLRDTVGQSHEEEIHTPDVDRLPRAEQQRLAKIGLYDSDDGYGMWDAHLQYHWTQTFPAHSTVHIWHEYAPVVGYTPVFLAGVEELIDHIAKGRAISEDRTEETELLQSLCTDRPFLSALAKNLHESESAAKTDDQKLMAGNTYPQWVDFILTSANTWRQPIEDFTLIVERGKPLDGYGKPRNDERRLISFCSPQNAPVTKLDADHFQVHLTNFIPQSELRIGFFDLPEAKPKLSK